MEDISKEFAELLHAFREEPQFKAVVLKDSTDGLLGFCDAWATTQGQFELLQQYCGGLASAFPNTATVESDFSIFGWEKGDTRMDLTDFFLEGILHPKQFQELKRLSLNLSEMSAGK